ncbi:hypothetical protein L2E82_19207 [Cichorium intybus]|uniref:Uncharacterized protein n=1 Tax=Cichorium intybus TaxID=13427 RepID=A0ACB9FBW9_CICIN|nr:hypothetical protein L2E82_19207 [Cichorium intybus]
MKRPTVEQETVAEKKRESENQIEIRYPKGIQESYDTVTPNSTSSSLKRSDLGIGNYESLIEARIISAMVHLALLMYGYGEQAIFFQNFKGYTRKAAA